jgi:hypothetical protein
MHLLGIDWVGVNADNGRKLLLSVIFVAVLLGMLGFASARRAVGRSLEIRRGADEVLEVVVTGASAGVGRATVEEFAKPVAPRALALSTRSAQA